MGFADTPSGSTAVVRRNGVTLQFKELSDGYQAFLVIVFDLALRYAYIFPSIEDPTLGEAVVGIDEVDLHLHPRWQRTVVSQLIDLFPNTQFVVTTQSPIGSLLMEDLLFDVESRYSSRFSELEQQADELQERVSAGTAEDDDYRKLKAALDEMEELAAKEDERRADTSTVAQITKMKSAFVKDLIEELQKARS